jgi:hypothetical protein
MPTPDKSGDPYRNYSGHAVATFFGGFEHRNGSVLFESHDCRILIAGGQWYYFDKKD